MHRLVSYFLIIHRLSYTGFIQPAPGVVPLLSCVEPPIVLWGDVKLANTYVHQSLLIYFSTYQTFVSTSLEGMYRITLLVARKIAPCDRALRPSKRRTDLYIFEKISFVMLNLLRIPILV